MPPPRNPYRKGRSKERTVRRSVVAMLDILGFREIAREAIQKGTENQFLNNLHSALSRGRYWLEHENKFLRDSTATDSCILKAFTDNIVIGWPIGDVEDDYDDPSDDAEGELADCFLILSLFQFEMIRRRFFVRGAISGGNIYIDDIAVVGGGLMEAYEGEAFLARDPRIVLTETAMTAVNQHLEYYGSRSGGGAHAPQNRELLRDADGQFFLNYLDNVVISEDDTPNYEAIVIHRDRVVENLQKYKSQANIWNKYAWVARYHNYFCDQHPSLFDEIHRVGIVDFQLSPSRIIDPQRKRNPFDPERLRRQRSGTKPRN
jgi:hypothetical protein